VCAVWAVLSYSLGRANEARRAPSTVGGTESSHA
jgi:hypothetical protein